MDIDYMQKLPTDRFVMDGNDIVIDYETFERISDYTRSRPTGPSPGRVYRKNLGWPQDMEDNWFIYFCIADPFKPGTVAHVPWRVLIT